MWIRKTKLFMKIGSHSVTLIVLKKNIYGYIINSAYYITSKQSLKVGIKFCLSRIVMFWRNYIRYQSCFFFNFNKTFTFYNDLINMHKDNVIFIFCDLEVHLFFFWCIKFWQIIYTFVEYTAPNFQTEYQRIKHNVKHFYLWFVCFKCTAYYFVRWS